jgi:hypothetical protein
MRAVAPYTRPICARKRHAELAQWRGRRLLGVRAWAAAWGGTAGGASRVGGSGRAGLQRRHELLRAQRRVVWATAGAGWPCHPRAGGLSGSRDLAQRQPLGQRQDVLAQPAWRWDDHRGPDGVGTAACREGDPRLRRLHPRHPSAQRRPRARGGPPGSPCNASREHTDCEYAACGHAGRWPPQQRCGHGSQSERWQWRLPSHAGDAPWRGRAVCRRLRRPRAAG